MSVEQHMRDLEVVGPGAVMTGLHNGSCLNMESVLVSPRLLRVRQGLLKDGQLSNRTFLGISRELKLLE